MLHVPLFAITSVAMVCMKPLQGGWVTLNWLLQSLELDWPALQHYWLHASTLLLVNRHIWRVTGALQSMTYCSSRCLAPGMYIVTPMEQQLHMLYRNTLDYKPLGSAICFITSILLPFPLLSLARTPILVFNRCVYTRETYCILFFVVIQHHTRCP